jgi:predicted DNA-binding transcriptional regulator AlpA
MERSNEMPRRSSNAKPVMDALPRMAMTIKQFCKSYAISRSLYYELRKDGLGPQELKVGGRRTVITTEAAEAWLKRQKVSEAQR